MPKESIMDLIKAGKPVRFGVMSDTTPYQSPVTGEMISSRDQHREHKKEHGLIEIGNEMPTWLKEKKLREKDGAPTV